MPQGSFTDLRLNREDVEHNESFWPSFTDIMTVVVMIFLIAMVVLLVRNMELVAELQRTIESERAAAELARATSAEKDSLSHRLEETRSLLDSIRTQLAESQRKNRAQAVSIDELTSDKERLQDAGTRLETELTRTQDELGSTQQQLTKTRDELDSAREQFAQTRDQLALSGSSLAQTESQRDQLQENVERLNTQVSELEQTRRGLESQLSSSHSRLASMESEAEKSGQQLAKTREELERTRDLLAEARSKKQEREAVIEEQFTTIDDMKLARERLSRDIQSLTEQLRQLTEQLNTTQAELVTARSDLSGTRKQLASLEEDYQRKEQELLGAHEEIRVTDARLADLQGEYDDISVKYNRLVKPARSDANKFVVVVRYLKAGGRHLIEYREPEDEAFAEISRRELNKRLAALRDRMPDDLYVRVVIPENSGLSYSEAWRFTNEMHTNYDYYFRETENNSPSGEEQPPDTAPAEPVEPADLF
ncbi:MAG: hypothetical protein ABFS23_05085 [Pseudomonadota bacterium]